MIHRSNLLAGATALSGLEVKRLDGMQHFACDLEVKAEDVADDGTFSGYGAVFNNEDQGGDVILKGAFRKSLAEWKAKKKLPKMLLHHGSYGADAMLPIGVWTSMEEDDYGLKVTGRLDPMDTDRGKQIYAGLRNRTLDGLSIGYKAIDFKYGTKPDQAWRTIKELKLFEVSVVLFGMNELATITDVKGQMPTERDLERLLMREAGLSAREAKAFIASGYKSLEGARDAADSDDLAAAAAFDRLAELLRA